MVSPSTGEEFKPFFQVPKQITLNCLLRPWLTVWVFSKSHWPLLWVLMRANLYVSITLAPQNGSWEPCPVVFILSRPGEVLITNSIPASVRYFLCARRTGHQDEWERRTSWLWRRETRIERNSSRESRASEETCMKLYGNAQVRRPRSSARKHTFAGDRQAGRSVEPRYGRMGGHCTC